jgi:hypothetical protein
VTAPPLIAFGSRHPAGAVPVSLDRLIESKLLIQANSGGGKSRAIRYLLEQTHGRVQHIVLDREGEFATLRERFPYLLAGRDGEVAADPSNVRAVKLLARTLLETGVSAVIDLSDLSLAQQREYVRVFVGAMNQMPRTLWKDCLIVIDEAHLFAPEKGKGESAAREEIALLLSTSRKRGFCVVLATQRIAKIDKDVSAECLNKMIGRTSEEDLRRAAEELGMDKATSKGLRALDPGSFWTYGPAIAAEPVLVRTGDVQTHPPKRGAMRAPAPDAPAAIKKVMAAFADLPKQAAEEQETVDALKREVRELRARAEKAEKGTPVGSVPHATMVSQINAAVNAASREHAAAIARLRKALEAAMKFIVTVNAQQFDVAGVSAEEVAKAVQAAVGQVTALVDRRLAAKAQDIKQLRASAERIIAQLQAVLGDETPVEVAVNVTRDVAFKVDAPASGNGKRLAVPRPRDVALVRRDGVTGVEQRILNTIAGMEALGVAEPDKATVAALVGYHPNAKSYSNAMGSLRTGGKVTYPDGGRVALTDEGRAIADNSLPVESREQLHGLWIDRLGNVAGRILSPLLEVYPDALPADAVAEAAGYHPNAKSFSNMKGRLRTLGLIDYPRPGQLVATRILFPEGLR